MLPRPPVLLRLPHLQLARVAPTRRLSSLLSLLHWLLLGCSPTSRFVFHALPQVSMVQPPMGFEPMTSRLLSGCSANQAREAPYISSSPSTFCLWRSAKAQLCLLMRRSLGPSCARWCAHAQLCCALIPTARDKTRSVWRVIALGAWSLREIALSGMNKDGRAKSHGTRRHCVSRNNAPNGVHYHTPFPTTSHRLI